MLLHSLYTIVDSDIISCVEFYTHPWKNKNGLFYTHLVKVIEHSYKNQYDVLLRPTEFLPNAQ